MSSERKEKFQRRFIKEIKEKGEASMAKRREGPIIGLILFSIALWGCKIFTYYSPGTHVMIEIFHTDIHFHHFHYGIILLVVGILITFFEGPWISRIVNVLFGAGLGLIIDEYWILLTFDDTLYFDIESYYLSALLGLVITVIYAVIAIGLFIYTKPEKKMWDELYEALKSGTLKIEF